jgi:7-cyano-7-deazaguanine reductase
MDPVSSVDPKVGQVAEGKVLHFETESAIRTEELKTFEFPSTHQLIEIDTHEFSAVCPFSGLPDIARVMIKYYPSTNVALELKALKYYFLSFRNVGIYQEGVTWRIYEDLCQVLNHRNVEVKTQYNTRGGIDVTCTEGGVVIATQG